jgi:hypothetical protein
MRHRSRDAVFLHPRFAARHEQKTPRRIASRRSFLRPGGSTGFGSIRLGARPDCATRDPGSEWRIASGEWKVLVSSAARFYSLFAIRYSPNKTRQAERRQTQTKPPHPSGCGAAPAGAARLPAFHCGSCGSEPTPPFSSSTRFLGRGLKAGVTRPRLSQSSVLHADRS